MDGGWDAPMKRQPSFPVALLWASIMLVTLGVFVSAGRVPGRRRCRTSVPASGCAARDHRALLLNLAALMVAFRVHGVEDVSWGDVFPGAVVGAVGWLILQTLGGYRSVTG